VCDWRPREWEAAQSCCWEEWSEALKRINQRFYQVAGRQRTRCWTMRDWSGWVRIMWNQERTQELGEWLEGWQLWKAESHIEEGRRRRRRRGKVSHLTWKGEFSVTTLLMDSLERRLRLVWELRGYAVRTLGTLRFKVNDAIGNRF
jgi:hypothetical protein